MQSGVGIHSHFVEAVVSCSDMNSIIFWDLVNVFFLVYHERMKLCPTTGH